jgi:hypothetical protein
VKFDLDKRCEMASSAGPSKYGVSSSDKMEGGFSKAIQMTKEDGTEVIPKIPSLIASPARYTIASEVAVMKYGSHSLFTLSFLDNRG